MPATEPVRLGRKRALPSCPNPLFLKWLTELRDEAKEKGLKIQYTYQKAINSLNKYPLPLKNAKEAKILQNFGDGICKILDEKLQRYYRENGADAPIHTLPKGAPPPGRSDNNIILAPSRKKNDAGDQGKDGGGGGGRKKKREYVPQKRSGGYAVLLTLYRETQIPGSKGYMFKMELQAEAQHLCDKSFTVPDLGSKYTAWSSVSTLIQKNLLIKTHNPARYSLTDEGLALAERLASVEQTKKDGPEGDREEVRSELEETEEDEKVVDLTGSDEDEEEKEDNRIHPTERGAGVTQVSGDVDDTRSSGKSQNSQTRSRNPNAECLLPGTYEIILCVDFIETTGKRMDDLEQKATLTAAFFRLKRCGLRKPIYLVEECGSAASHLSLPETTLQQAIVNTQVGQCTLIVCIHKISTTPLHQTERKMDPCVHVFTPHSDCTCQTVREVFARQLMQISGLSGDKAAAILEHYSTPHSLLTAYEQCASESEKEKLLASIRYGKLKRNLGPALSRTVYQLYCTQGALS
uniref:Crossover junction endonuclease MUS81 n=1 Tax=Amphilophus citrinellus TaxID=61819 RepID=A0A3Q0QUY4_AMPCI